MLYEVMAAVSGGLMLKSHVEGYSPGMEQFRGDGVAVVLFCLFQSLPELSLFHHLLLVVQQPCSGQGNNSSDADLENCEDSNSGRGFTIGYKIKKL